MASDLEFVQYIKDQIEPDCEITSKKMFGEYCLYSKGKVIALVCDNQLFVKPTTGGKKFIGDFVESCAYNGAKPSLLIDEQIEDKLWLSELIRITEQELPTPKPK
jgi:TfoX/Sxy family transcriptional regulator of competence genes